MSINEEVTQWPVAGDREVEKRAGRCGESAPNYPRIIIVCHKLIASAGFTPDTKTFGMLQEMGQSKPSPKRWAWQGSERAQLGAAAQIRAELEKRVSSRG